MKSVKGRSYFLTSAVVAFCCTCLLFGDTIRAASESTKGYDADLTLFSPEGRLYQVEYVMRAVGHYGCPSVGVHGEACCVVVCKRDLPDDLVYADSVTSIFRITDTIYSAATGMSGDVRYQVKRARLQALEYKRQYGSPMPSRLLALAMADAAQVNTQHAAMRPMACVSLIISVDDPAGPLLMRVEPSGQVFQAWGTAAGRGSATSVEFLEEAYKVARREREVAEYPVAHGDNRHADDERRGQKCRGSEGGESGKLLLENASSENGERIESEDLGAGVTVSESEGPPNANGHERSVIGLGVVGEEETVQLALQALSKVSSSEGPAALNCENVEVAIASRDSGIRVCSRTEVKGFLGRMACSPGFPPKLGR